MYRIFFFFLPPSQFGVVPCRLLIFTHVLQHDYDMRVDDFLRRTQAVVSGRRSRPRERERQRERERPRDARRERERERGRERDRDRDRIRDRDREKERGRYRR